MNPSFVFNRLDTLAPNPYDSSKRPVRFRGLFDVKMAHADDAFYQKAMQMVRCDSVASFLKEVLSTAGKIEGWRTGQGDENQNSLQHGTLPLEAV